MSGRGGADGHVPGRPQPRLPGATADSPLAARKRRAVLSAEVDDPAASQLINELANFLRAVFRTCAVAAGLCVVWASG